MKTFISIFFLIFHYSSFAQTKLPQKIMIIYYEGGDYRTEKIKGAFDSFDSLVYILKGNKYYKCTNYRKSFEVKDFIGDYAKKEGKPVKINSLRKYKKMFINKKIAKKNIETLLQYTNLSFYNTYEDTLQIDTVDRNIYYTMNPRNYILPKDFSYSYFGLDSVTFKYDCAYYKHKWKMEKDCNGLRDSLFLYKLLGNNRFTVTINSSSFVYMNIILYDEDKSIILSQRFSANQNIQWDLSHNEKLITSVHNPAINDLIYKMLPANFRHRKYLLDYKKKEKIMNMYFNR